MILVTRASLSFSLSLYPEDNRYLFLFSLLCYATKKAFSSSRRGRINIAAAADLSHSPSLRPSELGGRDWLRKSSA